MENIKDIINNLKINLKNEKLENYVPKKIDFDKIDKEMNESRRKEIKEMFQKRKKEIGEFNFDDFKTKIYKEKENEIIKIKNACARFCNKIDEMEKGLYLQSEISGSGKTFMTKIIANNLLDKQKMVKIITAMEIVKKAKSETKESDKIDKINLLQEVNILIIDDITNLKFTDFEQSIFFDILDTRGINKKITITTGNIKINDLVISNKLKTRFVESFYEIDFPELSIRNLKAEKDNKKMESILFS